MASGTGMLRKRSPTPARAYFSEARARRAELEANLDLRPRHAPPRRQASSGSRLRRFGPRPARLWVTIEYGRRRRGLALCTYGSTQLFGTMAILGTGTEIVECVRISKMIEAHGEQFLERVYTPNEIEYCLVHCQRQPTLGQTMGRQRGSHESDEVSISGRSLDRHRRS